MSLHALCLAPGDDVAVLLAAATTGASVAVGETQVTAQSDIPKHHKIALRDLLPGARLQRDGLVIGEATQPIARGSHVHIHNLRSLRVRATKEEVQ